jgi:hypothetical protein
MSALFAKRTGLFVGDGASPEVFTQVTDVKTLTGPDFKIKVIDTTTHSTTGNYMSKQAVLIDAGSIKFPINYDPANTTHAPATGLFHFMENLTTKHWQIRFPPSDSLHTQMSFSGFVSGHPFKFPVDGIVEGDIEVTLTDGVTWGTYS